MSQTNPGPGGGERPPPVERYAGEWVCQDCDYAEFRATSGATGNVVRCPACGGSLVHPQDAMA
jgi:hypothetical protein